MNPRESRGKQITEKSDQITRIDGTHYLVKSQSRKINHDVISTEFGWSCSCEDTYFRSLRLHRTTQCYRYRNYSIK